jgi:hypothetical protein
MYNLTISSKVVMHPAGKNFTFPLILTNQSLVTLVSLLRPCRLPITSKLSTNYLLLISKTLLFSHLSISIFTSAYYYFHLMHFARASYIWRWKPPISARSYLLSRRWGRQGFHTVLRSTKVPDNTRLLKLHTYILDWPHF